MFLMQIEARKTGEKMTSSSPTLKDALDMMPTKGAITFHQSPQSLVVIANIFAALQSSNRYDMRVHSRVSSYIGNAPIQFKKLGNDEYLATIPGEGGAGTIRVKYNGNGTLTATALTQNDGLIRVINSEMKKNEFNFKTKPKK